MCIYMCVCAYVRASGVRVCVRGSGMCVRGSGVCVCVCCVVCVIAGKTRRSKSACMYA